MPSFRLGVGAWVLGLGAAFAACGGESDREDVRGPEPAEVFETDLPGQIFTRGPGGEIVVGAGYDAPEDVFLYGTGLAPGDYAFTVVDFECTRLLAGPNPGEPGVPDTAGRVVRVAAGAFAAVPVAPFLPLEDGDAFYRVYLAPVTAVADRPGRCFGFPRLSSVTTVFQIPGDGEPAEPPPTSPVEPRL